MLVHVLPSAFFLVAPIRPSYPSPGMRRKRQGSVAKAGIRAAAGVGSAAAANNLAPAAVGRHRPPHCGPKGLWTGARLQVSLLSLFLSIQPLLTPPPLLLQLLL